MGWTRPHIPIRRAALPFVTLLVVLAPLAGFSAESTPPESDRQPVEVTPPDEALTFLTRRAVLWAGRSQVIPVRMKNDAPADDELTFPVSAADPGLVEILRPATVLAGEKLGFLRVRALRPGRTQLRVRGAELELDIRNDPVVEPGPRIIGPVRGAAVWGKFAVGVEMLDAPPRNELIEESEKEQVAQPARVQLRLPNGRQLEPIAATQSDAGPVRRFTFEVSADELPAGPLSLVAVVARQNVTNDSGLLEIESEPVAITVVRPTGPGTLLAGSCADAVEGTPKLLQALNAKRVALVSREVGPFHSPEDEATELLGDALKPLTPSRPSRFGAKRPKTGPMAGSQSGRVFLAISADPAWSLPFVAPAAARYQLFLRARGDEAMGVLPSVALYLNESEQPAALGRLVQRDWHRMPLGAPFSMEAGPQVLSVQFKNDFSGGKEDRNLFLDRYELLRLPDGTENPEHKADDVVVGDKHSAPPLRVPSVPARLSVALLYPRDGQNIFGADAVVARITDSPEHPAAWADVFLDDQSLGLRVEKPAPGQLVVFPLPARGLTGSSHHLRVCVADDTGRVQDSSARFVNFLALPPAVPGPYERAVHLLNRFAYGPEPRELAAVLTMGEENWLNARLNAGFIESAAEQETLARAIAKYPRLDDSGQTIQRALFQAINSDNPVRSRFTAFMENHFSTWMSKTQPAPKWHEHIAFVRLGLAPFADLLEASARSSAMLVYLDQEKSYARKLNENYAREIMELHTLGVHGGYSQTDVTTLAGLLTGWTLASEARLPLPTEEKMQCNGGNDGGMEKDFRYDSFLNDGKARRVFGIAFDQAPPAQRYDRVRLALEFLAAHPATAGHICRKIANHYVGTSAPDALVEDLTRVYLENGGDLRCVLRALAAHPLFWNAPDRLATPQDYALRLARLLRSVGPVPDGKNVKPEDIERFLKLSGMDLFDRVTPDGYPEQDAAYADSNALLQRWRFAQKLGALLNNLVPTAWRQSPPQSEDATLPANASDVPQRLIDLAALRLTGRLLPTASNKETRDFLGDTPTAEEMQQAIVFVSLLPESNLR